MGPKYYFTTKDLVTIAILAALGGVLSTYIGYLGNLVNRIVGVPFGAGQFMAGLHVIWIVLATGMTKKKGAGTFTGVLKGFVELFMGGTHGVVIILVSLVQGLIVDTVLFSDSAKAKYQLVVYISAAGLSSASNVFVFQLIYFSGVSMALILVLGMLACGSGMLFGGWMTLQIMDSLQQAGLMISKEKRTKISSKVIASMVVSILFLAAFTIGAVFYFSQVYVPPGKEGVEIQGEVEEPYTFYYEDFKEDEVTIRAELVGSVTYEREKNYTGIPLGIILEHALPKEKATELTVKAKDGYQASFELEDVMTDERMVVIEEGGQMRLIAGDYDGAYWVRDIYTLEVG